jgi:phosphoribosylformimino-5-aminoimidazole carboxamide ribotide isomerase
VEAIGAVARAVARPLQVAGGIDGPEQVELAFAAGATRVVLPLWSVVENHERLAACLRVAGDWLGVGMDARAGSLRGYPWRHRPEPRLEELVVELAAAGVRRFVFSHLPARDAAATLAGLTTGLDVDVLVAGGADDLDDLRHLRDAGVAGVILGEVLFTGRISLGDAQRALA